MFPSLRYTRLDPGCSLRAIYMTNGCIIPGMAQLVKSFFNKNNKNSKNSKKVQPRRSALRKKYPPAAPGDTTLYFAGFTIRFTSLFLTRMVLTTLMPSVAFFTLSLSIAAATTAASSLSTGTVTVPFSLPLTCTAIST